MPGPEDSKSTIGFETADAINSIIALKRQLDSYNATMLKIEKGTGNLNRENIKAGNILANLANSNQLTAATLNKLATSYINAGKEASKFAAAQAQVGKKGSFVDPRTPTAPLARQVSEAQARKHAEAEKALAAAAREAAGAQDQAAAAAKRLAAADALATSSAGKLAALQGQKRTGFQNQLGIDPQKAARPFGDTLAAASIQKQNAQLLAVESNLRKVAGRASETGKKLNEAGKEGAKGAQLLEISWSSVIRVFGGQFIARGLQNFLSELSSSVGAARKFEIQLAEIQTISEETQRSGINPLSESIQRLAGELGRPVSEVASGVYETISNQLGDGAEAVRAFGDAANFGIAAVVDLGDSVRLVDGIINAYGLTAASTTKITDQLFVTIDKGAVTGRELANTIGRVTTLAAQLGVPLAEVNAIFAELTIQGVNAADASTQLSNVLLKLLQPSDNTAAALRELGFASAEAGIQAYGLIGFLDELTKFSGKLPSEVAELLGGRVRAIRGVVGITANLDRIRSTLDSIEKSAGATKRALDFINETDAQQLTKKYEAVRAFLVNDFGRSVVSVLNTLIFNVNAAKVAVSALSGVFATLVTGGTLVFLASAIRSMKQLGIVALGAGASVKALSLVLLPLAAVTIGTLIYQFTQLKDVTKDVESQIQQIQEAADVQSRAGVAGIQSQVTHTQKAAQLIFSILTKQTVNRIKQIDQVRIKNLETEGLITDDLAKELGKREKQLEDFVESLQKKRDDAAKSVEDLNEQLADSGIKAEERRFERSVSNLGAELAAQSRFTRSKMLQQQALAAAQRGDADEVSRLTEAAIEQAEQAAEQTTNRAAGEREVATATATQQTAINEVIRLKEAEKARLDTILQLEEDIKAAREAQEEVQKRLVEQSIDLQRNIENSLNRQQTLIADMAASQGFVDVRRQGAQEELSQARKSGIGPPGLDSESYFEIRQAAEQYNKPLDAIRNNLTQIGDAFERARALQGSALGDQATEEVGNLIQQLQEGSKTLDGYGPPLANAKRQVDELIVVFGRWVKTVKEIDQNDAEINEIGKELATAGVEAGKAALGLNSAKKELAALQVQAKEGGPLTPPPSADGSAIFSPTEIIKARQEAERAKKDFTDPTNGSQTFFNPFVKGAQEAKEAAVDLKQNLDSEIITTFLQAVGQGAAGISNFGAGLLNAGQGASVLTEQGPLATQATTDLGNAGNNASLGINNLQSSVNSFNTSNIISQAQAAINVLQELIALQAQAGGGGGGGQAAASGGLIYRAGGGFVPRGTDTVPAMLSPGEFVVNARSSRKFYSELVAMNQGRRPVYREQGGPVTNQSFGDVEINLPESSSPPNVREFAKQLRRELGLKTVRLS